MASACCRRCGEALRRGAADRVEDQCLDLLQRNDELLERVGDVVVLGDRLHPEQVLLEARQLQLQVAQRHRSALDPRQHLALRLQQFAALRVQLRQQLPQPHQLGLFGAVPQGPHDVQAGVDPFGMLPMRGGEGLEFLGAFGAEGIGQVLGQALQGTEEALAGLQPRGAVGDAFARALQLADGAQAAAAEQHQQQGQRRDQQVQPRQEADLEGGQPVYKRGQHRSLLSIETGPPGTARRPGRLRSRRWWWPRP